MGDKPKAIVNGRIILNDEEIENNVLIFNYKIISISDAVPTESELIDAKEAIVSLGLIDVHIHGVAG